LLIRIFVVIISEYYYYLKYPNCPSSYPY